MFEHFLKNLWRWKCELEEICIPNQYARWKGIPLLEILEQNWHTPFIKLMENRMTMGAFRYGPFKEKSGAYNNIGSIEKRLKLYKETGNDEILVDIANLCMCEFVNGVHPNKHFESLDDSIHTERRK